MQLLDPLQLDRQVEQAARAYRHWRRQLRADPASASQHDPFLGLKSISTRATYQAVLQLPADLPARVGLQRWVAALTIERVTTEDLIEAHTARRAREHQVPRLGRELQSVRSLVLSSVLSADAKRRAAAAMGLVGTSDDAGSNALWWLARRHEAARRLGLGSLLEVESPFEGIAPRAVAEQVLDGAHDLSIEALGAHDGWQETIAAATSSEAVQGWPSRLTSRWLYDLFGRGLFAGLRLDPGPLPAALCGASFARALARAGTAFARARTTLTPAPFVLQQSPFDAHPMSYGALLSSLLLSPAFLRKRLGLTSASLKVHRQAFGRTMLASLRLQSVKAAVSACDRADEAREVHATCASKAVLAQVPPELAGVLPRYDPGACSALAGTLHAASLRKELQEQFDEDWFDNPRAHQMLREVGPSGPLMLDDKALQAGLRSAVEYLGEPFA